MPCSTLCFANIPAVRIPLLDIAKRLCRPGPCAPRARAALIAQAADVVRGYLARSPDPATLFYPVLRQYSRRANPCRREGLTQEAPSILDADRLDRRQPPCRRVTATAVSGNAAVDTRISDDRHACRSRE
jgi:hypothetical protein